ncbi:MAG TPA: DUF3943 domain-containing protein, partial [Polyangiaceae bacterium]
MGRTERFRLAVASAVACAMAAHAPVARAQSEPARPPEPASNPAAVVTPPPPVVPAPMPPVGSEPAKRLLPPRVPPAAPVTAVPVTDIAVDYNDPDPNRRWDAYFRAFFGGLFINYVIWQFDWFRGETFHVTRESIGTNLKTGFVWDDNTFKTNFFGHPYHGSMYYGAARGAGLSYWESLPYPWVNSFIWEFMGERHFAAPNDWIMTSYGGGVIGEALFRLSNEVLDKSASGNDRGWSETGTMAVSPMYGFQRLASGQVGESGPKPLRHPVRTDLNIGIDRFRTANVENPEAWDPT